MFLILLKSRLAGNTCKAAFSMLIGRDNEPVRESFFRQAVAVLI